MPLRARLQFSEIECACLFHAVTPVMQGSQLRALGAGPRSRFACHVLNALTRGLTAHGSRTAFTCTPHEKPHATDIRTRPDGNR